MNILLRAFGIKDEPLRSPQSLLLQELLDDRITVEQYESRLDDILSRRPYDPHATACAYCGQDLPN